MWTQFLHLQAWIGLSWDITHNYWFNQDQSAVSYLGNNLEGALPADINHNCVHLTGDMAPTEMQNADCSEEKAFVCEKLVTGKWAKKNKEQLIFGKLL